MRLRSILLAGGIAVAGTGSVLAADIYVPPPAAPVPMVEAPMPLVWSGAYVGLHGGYFDGHYELDVDTDRYGGDAAGLIGGVLAGYNIEYNRVVFGVEADFGLTDVSRDTLRVRSQIDGDDTALDYDLDWNAHLRARVGLPMGKFMPFIAGGLALADFRVSDGSNTVGGTFTGWTGGGGVDMMFNERLIGRVELLYDDYGSRTVNGAELNLTGTTIRGALIYHFHR